MSTPPERTPVFKGRVLELNLEEVQLPNGGVTTLEVIRHRGAGAVLALLDPPDAADPRVVLLRQYRHPCDGVIVEIPAGVPEPGEDFPTCAARELAEESGWRAGSLRFLTRFFTTPGFTDEVVHLFLATELTPAQGAQDADEVIEVFSEPLSTALEWVRDGTIRDAKTAVALLFLQTFRREF